MFSEVDPPIESNFLVYTENLDADQQFEMMFELAITAYYYVDDLESPHVANNFTSNHFTLSVFDPCEVSSIVIPLDEFPKEYHSIIGLQDLQKEFA